MIMFHPLMHDTWQNLFPSATPNYFSSCYVLLMGFYDEKLKKHGMKRDKNKKADRILFWGRLLREKKKDDFYWFRGKPKKRRKVLIVIWGYRRNKREEKKGEGILEPRRRL